MERISHDPIFNLLGSLFLTLEMFFTFKLVFFNYQVHKTAVSCSPIQGLHPYGIALSCSPCRPCQHAVNIRVIIALWRFVVHGARLVTVFIKKISRFTKLFNLLSNYIISYFITPPPQKCLATVICNVKGIIKLLGIPIPPNDCVTCSILRPLR